MTRTCVHDLRPGECALCKSDDWHEGIARVAREANRLAREGGTDEQRAAFQERKRELLEKISHDTTNHKEN